MKFYEGRDYMVHLCDEGEVIVTEEGLRCLFRECTYERANDGVHMKEEHPFHSTKLLETTSPKPTQVSPPSIPHHWEENLA